MRRPVALALAIAAAAAPAVLAAPQGISQDITIGSQRISFRRR